MKKMLVSMLALATIGVGAVGFSGCDGGDTSTSGGSASDAPITHTHEWEESITKEATCVEKGEKWQALPRGPSWAFTGMSGCHSYWSLALFWPHSAGLLLLNLALHSCL